MKQMEKAKIVGVYNYGKVHRYVVEKQKDIHGVFCNLLEDLGFSEDTAMEADVVFDDMDNEYIYIGESPEGLEAELFVTSDKVNLIIKADKPQEKITNILQKHFDFPE